MCKPCTSYHNGRLGSRRSAVDRDLLLAVSARHVKTSQNVATVVEAATPETRGLPEYGTVDGVSQREWACLWPQHAPFHSSKYNSGCGFARIITNNFIRPGISVTICGTVAISQTFGWAGLGRGMHPVAGCFFLLSEASSVIVVSDHGWGLRTNGAHAYRNAVLHTRYEIKFNLSPTGSVCFCRTTSTNPKDLESPTTEYRHQRRKEYVEGDMTKLPVLDAPRQRPRSSVEEPRPSLRYAV